MIERPWYLDRLKRLRGVGLAKVLTGMRRAGKSGILRLLEQSLLGEGADPASVLFVNLELMENAPLRSAEALLRHVRKHASATHPTFVLIDEAQEAEGIGQVAYTLLEDGRFDLYLTGSHSKLVESELADVMSGRFVEIPVFPLSFAEYHAAQRAQRSQDSNNQLFQRYLNNGGLPYALALQDDPYALRDYLDGVYHTVVRRDVTALLGKEDPLLLDAIATSLAEGLGASASASALSQGLTATGRACSDDTVSRYLRAFTDAYVFHRVPRLDLRTGALLKTHEKYYLDDLGIRTLLLGAGQTQLAGMLENVVYLELRRRYRTVHVGKHYARSICFVAEGDEGRAYFQVAPSVLDSRTLDAQLAPLRAERDNYPKTLLTLDEIGLASHEGIQQRNLVDWLIAV